MSTTPNREVLPENPDEYLQKILNEFSANISEVVNFGTHLLVWDVRKPREGKDNHIPSLFFRNILELGDSISILMKSSSIDPGKILLRSLLENSYGLIYLLEKNERKRALSYMVWKAIKQIKNYKRFVSDYPSSQELKRLILEYDESFPIDKFFDREDVKEIIETKSSLLKMPEFDDVYKEYNRTKNKRKLRNPPWYSLFDGPKNFLELSNYLDRSLIYEFQYRDYSENVHVTGIQKGIAKAGKDSGQIIQIRDFENCKDVYQSTIDNLIESFNVFTKKRIPNRDQEFRNWYLEFRQVHKKAIEENIFNYKK